MNAARQPVALRKPASVSILWRVFAVNAIVFGLAVFILIASPATVSNPIKVSELVVLVGGLLMTLAVNLLLLTVVLAPLRRLATLMGHIDPMRPGQRAPVGDWIRMSTEMITLSRAFNTMLDRIEAERRDSAHRALAAQEAERLRIARELHDEVGQTLTAVALRAERAAGELPDTDSGAGRDRRHGSPQPRRRPPDRPRAAPGGAGRSGADRRADLALPADGAPGRRAGAARARRRPAAAQPRGRAGDLPRRPGGA